MAEENSTNPTETQNLSAVLADADELLVPTVQPNLELVQVDNCLSELQSRRATASQALVRKVKTGSLKLQAMKEELNAAQVEIAKAKSETTAVKAELLAQLLDAERKSTQLEQELNDSKSFIKHHVLVTSEKMTETIRSRFGETTKKPMSAPALDAPNGIDGASASSTLVAVPYEDSGETSTEQPPQSIKSSSDEEMDTDVVERFSCDHCSTSFKSMAMKYRHEAKHHGETTSDESEENSDVEEIPIVAPKIVKSPQKYAQNIRKKRDNIKGDKMKRALLKGQYEEKDIKRMSAVLKEMKKMQRAMKVAPKKKIWMCLLRDHMWITSYSDWFFFKIQIKNNSFCCSFQENKEKLLITSIFDRFSYFICSSTVYSYRLQHASLCDVMTHLFH